MMLFNFLNLLDSYSIELSRYPSFVFAYSLLSSIFFVLVLVCYYYFNYQYCLFCIVWWDSFIYVILWNLTLCIISHYLIPSKDLVYIHLKMFVGCLWLFSLKVGCVRNIALCSWHNLSALPNNTVEICIFWVFR